MKSRAFSTVVLFTLLAGSTPVNGTPVDGAPVDGAPLHPVGDFDSLPPWPKEMPLEIVELEVHPPPDAAVRQKRFVRRNDPASTRALCLKLHEAIEPDAAGLDAFRRLVRQTRYADALDAYRAHFFDKLKNPNKYGAHTENLTGYQLKAGKNWVLKRVDPKFIPTIALPRDCGRTATSSICITSSRSWTIGRSTM